MSNRDDDDQQQRKDELVQVAQAIDAHPSDVLQHLTLSQLIIVVCQLSRLVLQDNNIPTAGKLAAPDDEGLFKDISGLVN